jgi:hypothetical protein
MSRSSKFAIAAAFALAIAAPMAQAQTQVQSQVHHQRHAAVRNPVVQPGDIVVHARRSYLDPGPTGGVGTGNRYVGDTTPYSFVELGMPFSRYTGGFENLPTRFNPPGRPEPLFEF